MEVQVLSRAPRIYIYKGGFMVGLFWLLVIIAIVLLAFGLKVIKQYERGVILTLGRYTSTKEPGLRFVFPVIQQMTKVDIRTTPVDVAEQEVITLDNVTATVDAVVYFKVTSPEKAILQNANYSVSTSQFAQAALRDVAGNVSLDDLLSKRDEISLQIKEIVDKQTDMWGVDIEIVKLQNIELPQDMKRAMARQAEAERVRRAVVINADGEREAAIKVSEAAEMLSKVKGGINIRTLQTLEKIAPEPSQKTVYVLPTDIIESFKSIIK